jgi:hypothetical protein
MVNGRATAAQARALQKSDAREEFLEELRPVGEEISKKIEAADRSISAAEDQYRVAGQRLLDARGQIALARESGIKVTFEAFLEAHGIGRTRAYELMAVAAGTKSVADIRMAETEKKRRQRAKAVRDVPDVQAEFMKSYDAQERDIQATIDEILSWPADVRERIRAALNSAAAAESASSEQRDNIVVDFAAWRDSHA